MAQFVEGDAIQALQGFDEAKCNTEIKKTKVLLQRVNWFRAIKLTAGSAASPALGLPPMGVLGELWGAGKAVPDGEVEQDAIASADAAAV
ncbi:hypothetical protein [Acidithiobacillus sp.]|uniref:hypothetical protein n=1 Tax=Acidithiobacillus sp. TaxID=1872118 RepID=UPI003D041452